MLKIQNIFKRNKISTTSHSKSQVNGAQDFEKFLSLVFFTSHFIGLYLFRVRYNINHSPIIDSPVYYQIIRLLFVVIHLIAAKVNMTYFVNWAISKESVLNIEAQMILVMACFSVALGVYVLNIFKESTAELRARVVLVLRRVRLFVFPINHNV